MLTGDPAVQDRTGYALFDARDMLVDASADFLGENALQPGGLPKIDLVAAVAKILPRFERLDSLPVEPTAAFEQHAAVLWRHGDALPVEAQTREGRWKLLTSHPRPDGGVALISIDITEMKRAQIAHI